LRRALWTFRPQARGDPAGRPRLPLLRSFPEAPTIRELGYDFVNPAVCMFAAPKGTPLSIVKKLDDAFRKAMDDPEFVRYMEQMQLEVTYRGHEDLKKYIEETYGQMGAMIKDLNIPKETDTKK